MTKSPLKKPDGRSETYPAIRKPAPISFHSICQSPRKLCATSDHACTERSFRRRGRSEDAVAWTWPTSAPAVKVRISSSRSRVTSRRSAIHMTPISTRPPTNSASVNRQPMNSHSTIPSATRGSWTRTGTPSPTRGSRLSRTATSRSRSPRTSTTRTLRQVRSRAPPRGRHARRAHCAGAPVAPTPGRSRRARSRARAPTRPPTPCGARSRTVPEPHGV